MKHFVTLSEVIKPAKTRRAGDKDYPILSMTMHDGLVDQADKFKKRIASIDTSPYKVIERNQLVVGFPIDEGVLSFQDLYDEAMVSPAYNVWDLKQPENTYTKYLQDYLRSPIALNYYASHLRGTTARRRTIPNDVFLQLPVYLPPFAEQQRLAAILDGADALRALRRDGVAALDELGQSLFLELFGDPAINPKNWKMVKLGDTTEVIGGYAFPSESFAEEGTGIVRISNIQNGRLALDGMARVPESEIGSGRNYRVKPNTILIAMSGATTGKIAVTPNDPKLDLLLNQRVGMFVLDDSQITLEYLQLVLVSSFYQRFVRDQAGGAAQPNISATKLESAQIPLPPLALQQEFARQIGQLETLKARARAQAVELDALFAALSARAFAGELS